MENNPNKNVVYCLDTNEKVWSKINKSCPICREQL
jgi:hypothetical protein